MDPASALAKLLADVRMCSMRMSMSLTWLSSMLRLIKASIFSCSVSIVSYLLGGIQKMASVESQLGDGSLNVIIGIVAAFRKRQMSFRKITAYDFRIFLVKFSISAEPLPFQLESRYIQVPVVQAAQEA